MKGKNFEWWEWKLIVYRLIHTPKPRMNFMVPSTVEMIRMKVTLHEMPVYEQKPGCSKGSCWRIYYKNNIQHQKGSKVIA